MEDERGDRSKPKKASQQNFIESERRSLKRVPTYDSQKMMMSNHKMEMIVEGQPEDDTGDIGDGKCSYCTLMVFQVLASIHQIVAVIFLSLLFMKAEETFVNPFYIYFAAVSLLATICGFSLLLCKKKWLVWFYVLFEIGFFGMFLYLFEWLVLQGRLITSD